MQSSDDAQSFLEATRKNAQLFAGSKFDRLRQIADKDEVVVLGRLSMGPLELPTAEYFKIVDGKICEIRLFFDRTALGDPPDG